MGRSSQAKQKLLEATLELIWTKSYCAVGVDAICAQAQVKKGSFYHYFTSKAELAAAAVENHWQRYKPKLEAIFNSPQPPLARLDAYFAQVHQYQWQRQQKGGHVCGCPYMDLGAEAATLEPAILQRVQDILQEYYGFFAATVQEAQEHGDIQVADAEAAARWLFAYFEGMLTQARIYNDPDWLQDLSQGARQLLGATTAA